MKWFKTTQRVRIVATNESTEQDFIRELKDAGISLLVSTSQESVPSFVQEDHPLVLLFPDYEVFASKTSRFFLLLEERNAPFFICSDDERWKQHLPDQTGYYLSANTHPLELARFLVEKLNLHPVNKQPAYAFSFFNF